MIKVDRSSTCLCWLVLMASAHSAPALYAAPQIISENSSADELSDEEIQQIKTAERFFSILEKNPRRGTALDRVYGHHVEFGSLDKFLESLRERADQETDNGAVWMLLGLFESQRGNDGAAVDAFKQAEQLRPQDAMASYYLDSRSCASGNPTKPSHPWSEPSIVSRHVRTHWTSISSWAGCISRAQRSDEALNVWRRLEALFPDDPRVLEQIAVTLAEEGQPALGLPRYEKLAELVNDDYRRVMFQVAAADLRIKSGQRDEGIANLEDVLANLNPDSWLYRDVRHRIDDVFLRSGDQDNLVKYYQRWLEATPRTLRECLDWLVSWQARDASPKPRRGWRRRSSWRRRERIFARRSLTNW